MIRPRQPTGGPSPYPLLAGPSPYPPLVTRNKTPRMTTATGGPAPLLGTRDEELELQQRTLDEKISAARATENGMATYHSSSDLSLGSWTTSSFGTTQLWDI